MKHIKLFEEFVNEAGIDYSDTIDANFEEIGVAGEKALNVIKPFPLTGQIKVDAPKLIKFIADACKKAGLELDTSKAVVYNGDFYNEIEIPVTGSEEFFFQTNLDYDELANGSDLGGAFASDYEGVLGTVIDDLTKSRMFLKAVKELKNINLKNGDFQHPAEFKEELEKLKQMRSYLLKKFKEATGVEKGETVKLRSEPGKWFVHDIWSELDAAGLSITLARDNSGISPRISFRVMEPSGKLTDKGKELQIKRLRN